MVVATSRLGFDGLVTIDAQMLADPKVLCALDQMKQRLVITRGGSGTDPIKATGLLFASIDAIVKQIEPDTAQIWTLDTVDRRVSGPWKHLQSLPKKQQIAPNMMEQQNRLLDDEMELPF